MKPGTKQKPSNLKLIQGDPGKRGVNENEPKPQGKIPSIPEWVAGYAREVWKRLAEGLYQMGILTYVDRDMFAMYCTLVSAFRDAVRSGDVKEQRLIAAQARIMAAEFGLTPSARAMLHSPQPDETGKDADRKKRLFG